MLKPFLVLAVATTLALNNFESSAWSQVNEKQSAPAAPQSKIYLAPDDHTDYFWTADDVEYRRAFLEMLDFYLDEIDRTENEPPELQTKWNCDGSLWLWEYEHHKPAEDFERLIKRVRDGHISAPMTALVSTFGAQPAEAVLRGMYYAGSLERRFDLKFPMAVAMENQTLPLGLGALWAGSGAKYSWRGVCACATKMPYDPFQRRDHEIYWWTGLDDSRILMKWYSLGHNNASIGGYAEARKPGHAIDYVRNDEGFKKRHPFGTIGLFGQGWDDLKTLTNDFPNIAKQKSLPNQPVIVSNEEDFFREFERQYGGGLARESLAYGNEWDLYCVSMAEQTSRVRRSVEKLRTAEALATLVSLDDPDFWSSRKEARDLAHLDLGLYWEHDWTSDRNEQMRAKRAKWQRKLADEISAYVDELHDSAAKALATRVPTAGSQNRFYVFNSLGWRRDGFIELPLSDLTLPGTPDFHVIDVETQTDLQAEFLMIDGKRKIHVEVKDIPSVGYRVIEVRPGKVARGDDALPSDQAALDLHVLENEFLKVVVSNSGVITSLKDKRTGHDYAGRKGLNTFMANGETDAKPGEFRVVTESALGKSVQVDCNTGVPYRSKITLHQDADWLEIENTINGVFLDVRSWGFDFNLTKPDVHHEEVGAILNAKLESEGGHYARRNARYDWLSLGHFVDMQGVEGGITLANSDCAFFQLGNSTPRKLDTATSTITVLAGGQVDGPKLGIPAQNGDDHFLQRFALRPRPSADSISGSGNAKISSQFDSTFADDFDSVAAMRWAMEWQNPLVAQELSRNKNIAVAESPLSADKFSFLSVVDLVADSVVGADPANEGSSVMLWSLKPCEEGIDASLICRAWNVSNSRCEVLVQLADQKQQPKLSSAQSATHIETDQSEIPLRNGAVPIEFAPQQMRTIRLKF